MLSSSAASCSISMAASVTVCGGAGTLPSATACSSVVGGPAAAFLARTMLHAAMISSVMYRAVKMDADCGA